MQIRLDFTGIVCELGHTNACTNPHCEICNESFDEQSPNIDPKVEKRKVLMMPIFEAIQHKENEIKSWFKQLRINEVSRIVLDEPFNKLQEY